MQLKKTDKHVQWVSQACQRSRKTQIRVEEGPDQQETKQHKSMENRRTAQRDTHFEVFTSHNTTFTFYHTFIFMIYTSLSHIVNVYVQGLKKMATD